MKKYIFILISILAFACTNNNPIAKPETLLDQEEMENILYDISIIQSSQTISSKNGDIAINISDYIYKKYEIDSTIFFQNQRYYSGDVKKINKMYKNVLERVQIQKTQIDTLINKGKTPNLPPNETPQIR